MLQCRSLMIRDLFHKFIHVLELLLVAADGLSRDRCNGRKKWISRIEAGEASWLDPVHGQGTPHNLHNFSSPGELFYKSPPITAAEP